MPGAKPGERRGGRVKGVPNKRKAALENAIAVAGVSPKDFMLEAMAFHYAKAQAEKSKGSKADLAVIAAAYEAGHPFATSVAKFCHAALASVEHMGKGGGPIEFTDARDRLAHLLAREAASGDADESSRTTH